MLKDAQLEKYADVLIWALKTARTEKYKSGDIVLIRSDLAALRLAEHLQGRILDLGMHPVVRPGVTSSMETTFYQKANNRQLVFYPPGEKAFFRQLHGSIYLYAPESLTHLSKVDPKKIAKAALARKCFRDILDKREEKGKFGWTLCMLPTAGLAKHAGLSERQYANQVVKACFLDTEDPVAAWKAIHRSAGRVKRWLNRMKVAYFRVESASTDLKIAPGRQRKWVGISGHNIPSFEIFISPDWRGTEGVYFADLPSYRSGNLVEGIRLEFKKGKVVGVRAKKGRDFVNNQLAMDPGARRVGEFSLTDKRFSKINRFMANTLYDENHGGRFGNCHIALGASYSDTYDGDASRLTADRKKKLGFNDSALHWDLVNKEKKRVTARLTSGADVVVYEDGMFRLDKL